MKLKKTKYIMMALLIASSVGLSACNQNSEEANSTSQEESMVEVLPMSGEELAKIEADKKKKEKYLVIDVRSPEEYKEGHLKFAINMPIDNFEENVGEIDGFKDKDVALYCNSGKKSGKVGDILVSDGFRKVYNADGVKQYDYDLVKFNNLLGPEFVKAIKSDDKKLVIDARDAKDFDKGTQEGAVNIQPDSYDANKDKLPKDKNEPIYVFCYSGNKSATVAQKLIEDGYTNVTNGIDGTKEYDFGF